MDMNTGTGLFEKRSKKITMMAARSVAFVPSGSRVGYLCVFAVPLFAIFVFKNKDKVKL